MLPNLHGKRLGGDRERGSGGPVIDGGAFPFKTPLNGLKGGSNEPLSSACFHLGTCPVPQDLVLPLPIKGKTLRVSKDVRNLHKTLARMNFSNLIGLVTHQSPSRAKQTPLSAERLSQALERRTLPLRPDIWHVYLYIYLYIYIYF